LLLGGLRSHLDDREEYTSGWKFNDWEIKGIPLRINIGLRDINQKKLELVRRDTKEKIMIDQNENVLASLNTMLSQIQNSMYEKALQFHNRSITRVYNYEEMQMKLEENCGFIVTNWCGSLNCEIKVKNNTGADIRVIPFDSKEKNNDYCTICGKLSKYNVMFAKAY
jgi:prolyl-tRNA synthetase